MLIPWKESYDQPRQHIKNQRHYFANKGSSSQGYGFSSSHIFESWTIKKAEHQRTDALELWYYRRLLRVPWTARISNQSTLKEIIWLLIGRTNSGAEASILWPPDAKSWKDPNVGKDWRQEEKGMTEYKMAGWHHVLNGRESDKALRDGEGQRSLVGCNSWGRKESDMTEQLNKKTMQN